jgi:hypothetical protein
MSTWRKKAMELFYDMRYYFQNKDDTIYMVFFALLPRVKQAHQLNDIDELNKIYGYAEWCLSQKSKNLWKAAGVAFYEHLVDADITYQAIPLWIKPAVFEQIYTLFKARLGTPKYKELVETYNQVNNTMFS